MRFRWFFPFVCVALAGAQAPKPTGDYSGVLGPLQLKLHLKAGEGGALQGTLDSPNQGAMGLPCANFRLDGKALSFEVPRVGGKWSGTVSGDGAVLSGTWSQGAAMPLEFRRDEPFAAAEKPSPVDGVWLGALDAGGNRLRIQVHVKTDRAGKHSCTLDSLDQGAAGIPCGNVALQGDRFSFEVPAVGGKWTGALAKDGNTLEGTWSQGGASLPLRLARQAAPAAVKVPEPPKYDAALPPVPAGDLKAVLDRDLAAALKDGSLAPAGGGGVVIGISQRGTRRIFAYGLVKEDSIFEIGSITKTFTGLILAQMVAQGKVKLDEPVRELLPSGTVAKPEGAEITLLDLATQRSGLPRLPGNLRPADREDPYADYRPANLYEFIAKQGVARPSGAGFLYSNLGLGLLGQALANRAGTAYPELLKAQVLEPLKMRDTAVELSPGQAKRFVQGHAAPGKPAKPWRLDALAGAGAIRSTAADMLTYLEAQLHPERVPGTIAGAIKSSQSLRADVSPDTKVGLAWLYDAKTGNYWHNGATGGYSAYAFFNPKEDSAAVVLFNNTLNAGVSFADNLGQHIAERMTGRQAITLR